jgi:CHAD domain-containing protein
MATSSTIPGSKPEHRGLKYWMERVLKELDKVQAAPDPDAVHDLRVAIRRCRAVAAVMEEVDPDRSWREMRKLGRKLFRQLGELRDTQVLEEWTKKLGPEADPVRQRLLALFGKNESELRELALRAGARFDSKTWQKLGRTLQRRAPLVPPDRLAAECLALERLEAAKELHMHAVRTDKPAPWHELRIGVKRFRYTVESLLPARYENWGDTLKRVQDLLGDIHDLDVLTDAINTEAAAETEEARATWTERIATERYERTETYRQLALGKASLWHEWREGLPHGDRLNAAALARLRATARAIDDRPRRTWQVSRLAIRLYDTLSRAHASPLFQEKDLRKVMRAVGRLHGIGTSLDPNSPQKAARKFLRDMVLPAGWTAEEWELLVNVVRYHRGTQPKSKHKSFAQLSAERQRAVCALAGILRLARMMRKCGVDSSVGLRAEKSVDALILWVPGLADSEEVAARLAAGKHLLESSLGQPLIVKASALIPKVVELPRKEEPLSESAAASD